MKKFFLPLLCALALPCFADPGLPNPAEQQALRSMMNAPIPTLTDQPSFANGLVAPNNTTALFFNSSNIPVYQAVGGAAVNIISAATGQILTLPQIKNGLTATGSVANDFSGSTGAFKPSTGGYYNTNTSYTPSGAATVTLTAAQSGGTFLFDAATGVAYTLPAPAKGLNYNFQSSVSVTSNAHEVQTSVSSVFIEGVVAQFGTTIGGFLANGTTHQAIKMTGTTLGGLIGTQLKLECVDATHWKISGVNMASGTVATPFTATP